MAIIQGEEDDYEQVVGLGQYFINDSDYSAEVSCATSDNYQSNGIASALLTHLSYLAQKKWIAELYRLGLGGKPVYGSGTEKYRLCS